MAGVNRSGARGLAGMSAYQRHQKMVHDYIAYYGGSTPEMPAAGSATAKTDWDSVKEHHRFLRSEEDDRELTWEVRLAKKYYDKLFKEYCLADLSRYKESKIGMRWRTSQEVVAGKGQFICGNKRCSNRLGLASFEVNFGYREGGEAKQALVKLRVCPDCADKLNHNRKSAYKRVETCHGAASEGSAPAGKRDRDEPPGGGTDRRGRGEAVPDERGKRTRRDAPRGEGSPAGKERGGVGTEGELRNVWAEKAAAAKAEASQEEEFEQYFQDMFM